MPKEQHGVEKAEFSVHGATLTLQNGVTVRIAANKGYLHLNFSGIGADGGVVATPMSHLDESPKHELQVANCINLFYPQRPA